jgi:hypothetical protein
VVASESRVSCGFVSRGAGALRADGRKTRSRSDGPSKLVGPEAAPALAGVQYNIVNRTATRPFQLTSDVRPGEAASVSAGTSNWIKVRRVVKKSLHFTWRSYIILSRSYR